MNPESSKGNPNATEDAQENNDVIDQTEELDETENAEESEEDALFGIEDLEGEDEDADEPEDETDDENDDQEAEDALQNEESETDEAGEDAEAGADEKAGDKKEVLSPDRARYRAITEEAKRKVEEITGEAYDEFNDEHRVILADQAQVIGSRKRKEESAFETTESIIAANGGDQFRAFLADHMQDLPVRAYNQLADAEAAGDFSKTIEVVKAAAEKFKGDKVKTAARQKAADLNKTAPRFSPNNKQPQPPKTIGSGTGAAPARHKAKETFGLEDLGLDADD
jgi:hypothetical protein